MNPTTPGSQSSLVAGRVQTQDRSAPSVLIVEDDPALREAASLLLEGAGYRVLEAGDGETALSILQNAHPQLIVSDVMMPGMDGFSLCEQVRADPDRFQIPFIFLTGRGDRKDFRRGMRLGADDYLTKPFEPEELLAAVQLRLARAMEAQTAVHRAASETRETILRVLGHEFRTPMTLVAGYGELLEDALKQISDDGLEDLVGGLQRGSQRLSRLIEDLLLLSKLESGELADIRDAAPRRTPDPERVVAQSLVSLQQQAEARDVTLVYEDAPSGATVAVASEYLVEVVRRLVDNAIKFSRHEGGRVALSSRQEGGFWVLDVADNGIGIAADHLDAVFQAFHQVDRDKVEQQGAGLGLAIVRGLTELYGGRITVESQPGQGSKFSVWLPVADNEGSRVSTQPEMFRSDGLATARSRFPKSVDGRLRFENPFSTSRALATNSP